MAVDHYENFPVASLLLPRELRTAVGDIYRFARTADDIADEGDASAHERLAVLAEYRVALERIAAGDAEATLPHPAIFGPLQATIRRHSLPPALFTDLLSAFEQDITKHRYEDETEIRDYCRRSADPVGRLLLHLYDRQDDANLAWSDAICTGLQLTNFWQDVALDWKKGRIYLPRQDRERYGVSEEWIARCTARGMALQRDDDRRAAEGWRSLMHDKSQQARALLVSGMPLPAQLPWRAGLELRLVIQGGLRILERLEQINYDVFARRPVLRPSDWPLMALRAFFK